MGVDWVRMRLLPGVTEAGLRGLVAAQAERYAAAGRLPADLAAFAAPAPDVPHDPAELERRVERDTGDSSVFRVNALVANPVFPAEWRRAALRTHLPGELPGRLRVWRAHLERVRAGAHRPYLRAWHAYVIIRRLADEWAPLRALALAARDRDNAWALRPDLVAARERIIALPVPAPPPAPRWDAAGERGPLPVPFDVAPFAAAAREWNRRVPAGRKVHVTAPVGFASFLAAALEDEWLRDCLEWLDGAVRDGRGVLLW